MKRIQLPRGVGMWLLAGVALCAGLDAAPVSYHREVVPLLQRHCYGCHHPGKRKGDADLTALASMREGGKHGPSIVPGEPGRSVLITEVSGADPAMPKDGERLTSAQVGLLERWIREGAVDDSPPAPPPRTVPPDYRAPPVITAVDFSADGRWLAVGGYYEVLVFDAASLRRVGRWVGAPARVEALKFSPDSQRLAVVGGEPGVTGEFQIWDVASGKALVRVAPGTDSFFGADWSPDGTRVAMGGADRSVRVLATADGRELLRAMVHSDWVLGAVFVGNGSQVVSGSRDRSLRLLDAGTGRMLDVLNRETEPVVRLLRHPKGDQVGFAGAESRVRVYKAALKPANTDPGQDPNLVREFDSFPRGTTAVAFSGDGERVAVAGLPAGEVRVHEAGSGRRVAALAGHRGAVFGLAFAADGRRLATVGLEGELRVFELPEGRLLTNTCPVEVQVP
jgi:WD40 repeat protein/mono/diheme cytochrome c family protein